jgi:hypothetical protein
LPDAGNRKKLETAFDSEQGDEKVERSGRMET